MDKELKPAQDKLLAQRNVNEQQLATSPKLSKTELAKWMALTQARFQHSPVTELQATLWLEDWERLSAEFGAITFRRAISQLWTKAKFFPLPGEIRTECENMEPPPEPMIPEYKHFEPPADPITKEEFSAMLDKFPQLNAMREPK
jgi:hypothetical protein